MCVCSHHEAVYIQLMCADRGAEMALWQQNLLKLQTFMSLNSRESAGETWATFHLVLPVSQREQHRDSGAGKTERSQVLMLLVTPAFNKSKCPTVRKVY